MSERGAEGPNSDEYRIFYFMIPLSEPLGVPQGFVFAFTGPQEPGWEEFVAWCEAGHQPEKYEAPTYVSLRFWQVPISPKEALSSVKRVTRLAERVLGPELGPRMRRWRLRSLLFRARGRRRTRREAPRFVESIVEASVVVTEDLEGARDPVSDAFDRALAHVQLFQRGLFLATRTAGIVDTRESLPSMVFHGERRVSESKDLWPTRLDGLLVNSRLRNVPIAEVTSEQVMSDVVTLLEVAQVGNPFATYADLAREAQVASLKRGDYRSAVVLAATASEFLLDSLLSMLLWEESTISPEDAAKQYFPAHFGLARRVKTHYASRLGGSWSVRGSSGPVATWYGTLIELRHRVVHAGVAPMHAEVPPALDSLWGLENHLKERLSQPSRLARYPRTAMHLLGRAGLEQRGVWAQWLLDLSDDTAEPKWLQTFERWNFVLEATRQEQMGEGLEPSETESLRSVLLLDISGSELGWYQHDPFRRKVRRAQAPGHLSDAMNQYRQEIKQRAPFAEPQSIGLVNLALVPATADEPWVWDYKVLPLLGVMLVRSGSGGDPGKRS